MKQEALKLAQHWSDCAVHSEPAYPKGECDCGGIVAVADYTALSDKYVALSDKYVALSDKYVALKEQRKPLSDQTIELKASNLENATSDTKWGFEQGAKWARENT
jgi:hypothetical protein